MLRIDLVETVSDDLARGVMQLGGELSAGGAGADDRNVQLAGLDRRVLMLGAQAGVDHALVEAGRLLRRLQRHCVLAGAGGAEIVGDAADRNHQRVVTELALRIDLAALVVDHRGQLDDLAVAVETIHLAEAVVKAVPVRLGQIVQLVLGATQRAGGDRMQQRLPDVGAAAVDQGDADGVRLAVFVAERGGEFQATGAAADDNNPMGRITHQDVRGVRASGSPPVTPNSGAP